MLDLDFYDVCRDEDCPHGDHLHAAHGPSSRRRRGAFVVKVQVHQLMLDVIYDAVDARVLRPFSTIYRAVLDDYGSVTERRVYRGLHELVSSRRIAAIAPSGSASRLRSGGFVRAGYVRYDSPLLSSPDGFHTLVSQADDLHEDMVAAVTRPRA